MDGEDPCDDDLGYWDDVFEECYCWNGQSWSDSCEAPPPPPVDDDDPDGGGGDSGGNAIAAQIGDLVDEDPFVLLDVPCNQISWWVALANHTIPASVSTRLTTEYALENVFGTAFVQTINDAHGAVINMDYYAVTVPITDIPGGLTPQGFLNHVRTNINAFVDGPTFNYYPGLAGEEQRWLSNSPLGTVFSIDLTTLADGSVVTTSYGSDHWTFTTVWTPADFYHPVSGNRVFGVSDNGNGTATFYTRGTDRISTRLNDVLDDYFDLAIYERAATPGKFFSNTWRTRLVRRRWCTLKFFIVQTMRRLVRFCRARLQFRQSRSAESTSRGRGSAGRAVAEGRLRLFQDRNRTFRKISRVDIPAR